MSSQIFIGGIMADKSKSVATFEFLGNPKEASDLWTAKYSEAKDEQDFIKNYFNKFLGKPLKREDTKGRQCIRVYTNNKGNLVEVKIYDAHGLQVSYVHFCMPHSKGDKKNERKKPPLVEEESTIRLLDVEKKLKNCITSEGNLVIKKKTETKVFKNIFPSNYDIYIQDPYIHDILSDEYLLYKKGYKMVEAIYLDIDGIINFGKWRSFNPDGLVTRQIFYQGTPWGGIIANGALEWRYEFDKKMIVVKHINIVKNLVDRISEYELDEKGNIKIHNEYLYDKHGPDKQSYRHWRKHIYNYDDKHRIIEIATEEFGNTPNYRLDKYVYDSFNRLVCEETFSENKELEYSTTYEYVSETKVRMKSKFYPKSFVYEAYCG